MVYMLLAAGAVTSAAGTGTTMGVATAGRFPLLALALAVFMVGYVMWQADRLTAVARASTAPAGPPALVLVSAGGGQATQAYEAAPDPPSRHRVLSPRLAACCQIAMAVTMGYMLILLL